MMTVGLVRLPGMMTGQILGGASPLTALRYQIVVVFIRSIGIRGSDRLHKVRRGGELITTTEDPFLSLRGLTARRLTVYSLYIRRRRACAHEDSEVGQQSRLADPPVVRR
jgi:hypothetical protein